MSIKEYFDAHPNQRLLFKHGVILAIGGGLTLVGVAVSNGMVPAEYGIYVLAILHFLNEKYKLLNPLEPWPVVGAAAKKRR